MSALDDALDAIEASDEVTELVALEYPARVEGGPVELAISVDFGGFAILARLRLAGDGLRVDLLPFVDGEDAAWSGVQAGSPHSATFWLAREP